MNKYIGKVIDNNHPDKDGRVQIYVEHLHHSINKDDYPWFKQEKEFTSFLPEINEYVWCWFMEEKFHRQGYFGQKVTLSEYHNHNETIGSITAVYPNVKYIQLANGNAIALSSDSDNAEISIYHKSGAEIYMNNDGEVHIKGSAGTLESTLLGETLKGLIEQILDGIVAITVPSPLGPLGPPVNAATFTATKAQLPTALSKGVKNN